MKKNTARTYRNTGKQAIKSFTDQYPRVQALLDRLRAAELEVNRLREKRELLRMVTTDTSVHLMLASGSDSPDKQKIQTALAEIDELKEKILVAATALQAIRIDVAYILSRVSQPPGKKVLQMYFFEHKNWRTIASETHFAISAVFRYREKGLEELEAILKAKEEAQPYE